jgi:hypothetical protein
MRQCEGILGTVLESTDGWPLTRHVRCGQVVGLTPIRAKDGCVYRACRTHLRQVQARVDRCDATTRARYDRDEELRSIRPEFGNREIVRL